jgi:hypothetical protein
MARLAQAVIPGMPRHGTQRGNRRQQTLFKGATGKGRPLLAMVGDRKALRGSTLPAEDLDEIRGHGCTGRPLGNQMFLERFEGDCWPDPQAPERRPGKKSVKLALCPPIAKLFVFDGGILRVVSLH